MNCLEFVQLAGELADDRLTDATVRKSALAHALSCACCAALLADERLLARGLRAWADDTARTEAPAPVKQALLAVFEQTHSQPVRPAAVAAAQQTFGERLAALFGPQRLRLVAAVAALLLLGLYSLAFWSRRHVTPEPEIVKASPTPAPSVQPLPNGSTPTATPIQFAMHNKARAPRRLPQRRATSVESTGNQLVARYNEFIPLTYAANPQTLRNGLLVRVEVPRATLLAMGLPLNDERVRATIKADLMMGEDGVAYAIRLVNN